MTVRQTKSPEFWVSTALVVLVAMAQIAFAGFFALAATSGDGFGIARAMAVLLAIPLVVLTLPAMLLLRQGRSRLAVLLAATSVLASWWFWRSA